jgi:hypothetical protein
MTYVAAEHLKVGDVIVASEHKGTVGGHVTEVVAEVFGHLTELTVPGGASINAGGRFHDVIKGTSLFEVA